ncbi:MAG: acyl-CoA dehydratase activase [Clostridiales bacterium]|nr:acyl-CoA dehydratase activase [Clostridiales bacterium]
MIIAGIDMGMENVKVVIMENGQIRGRGKNLSGGAKRASAAEKALEEALSEAGMGKDKLEKIIATGKGKFDLPFADRCVSEAVTTAHAAKLLCPEATTAVDAGADETVVVTLGTNKLVDEMAINEKCAAGPGIFLRTIARRLELTMEEMNGLPPVKPEGPRVNDGCVVFAETDALSLLNWGASPKDIAAAATDAAAVRVCTAINDITGTKLNCAVLFGGLAKNAAFVNALQRYAKLSFVIPDEAEYAGAIGAACAGMSA